ncbi:hypothetical protein FHS14_001451 [Paenibacillus baekrokdamisoli]|nr:hypothetical protein [Paenibacillus baekrokdamisoli]MBB3068475.1 hypothetical protein [Paenibacillus baekrokdamisoli]
MEKSLHSDEIQKLPSVNMNPLRNQMAFYQSVKKFESLGRESGIHWFGRIKDWKVIRRREITELPARPGTRRSYM